MRGWERIKFTAKCSYGCELQHADWAWLGKWPFVVCEEHAKQYGIVRGATDEPKEDEPMTSLADLAKKWKR